MVSSGYLAELSLVDETSITHQQILVSMMMIVVFGNRKPMQVLHGTKVLFRL